jgi:hypothetical protein
MSKKQIIELNMLNFVLNAPTGTRLFYGESVAKPSWLVEELVDQLYKLGYVHKEQKSCATGLNHYYIVRTLKPLD